MASLLCRPSMCGYHFGEGREAVSVDLRVSFGVSSNQRATTCLLQDTKGKICRCSKLTNPLTCAALAMVVTAAWGRHEALWAGWGAVPLLWSSHG